MTKRNLIIVHRGPEYERDFQEIAEKIRTLDANIDVFVCDPRSFSSLPKSVWERPVFILALIGNQFVFPRGAILQSKQIDKVVQMRMAAAEGISVPPSLPFRFGMWLDPIVFGDFVIIKPRDVRLMSNGEGIHLFRRLRLQTLKPDYFPGDHPIFKDKVGYMVQRYIDQGQYPTYNRVLTFLGQPIYMASGRRTEARPDLSSPDEIIESCNITIQGGPRERRWGVDDDIRELAIRVAKCFSRVPLLAIDIIREEKTGRPFFLECNPGGNTWHFSSNQPGGIKIRMVIGEADKFGKARALELGRTRMIEQTGAFDIVAAALVDETRARAV